MHRIGLAVLKLALPAALFGYLLWSVPADDYRAFWSQSKRWELLLAAQLLALVAVIISFMRWRLLVLAFGIPFTIREALRLGFLGYLLNFISFGSVGGDVFKAILVARDRPEKRPEAVASVLVDRAIGLMGLVMLAWISLVLFAQDDLSPLLIGIKRGAAVLSVLSMFALAAAIFAGRWFDQMIQWVAGLPIVGETLARMARAVRQLRDAPGILLLLSGLAIFVHSLLAVTIYLISCGIYPEHPTLKEHMMVVPPGMAAGALPLAPGGLGVQEGALAGLFRQLPDLPRLFSAILVATVYRLITIAIAGIGVCFYMASHGREFKWVRQAST
ncbi:MAG: flippase-like domain-containing protein [Planctomycetales bacterium]|nr:flippase-like domain-containing protein [Planctomycetales bacterium]